LDLGRGGDEGDYGRRVRQVLTMGEGMDSPSGGAILRVSDLRRSSR
jgi:hypothetical protein